jgi:hypothetical protein
MKRPLSHVSIRKCRNLTPFLSFSLIFVLASLFATRSNAQPNFQSASAISSTDADITYDVIIDGSGNAYYAGGFGGTSTDVDPGAGVYNLTSAGSSDAFLLKLDASGNLVWALRWGSTGIDQSNSLEFDPAGNIVIGGFANGTVDFDPGAGVNNLSSASDYGYVMKVDPSGNFLWARHFPGSAHFLLRMHVDGAGNIYPSGSFSGTVDFDPGAGTSNLISAGNHDAFVVKLDGSGNLLWARSAGSTGLDRAYPVITDASGNVYVSGPFAGTVDFDPGAGTFNLVSAGGVSDVYVWKLDASGNLLWAVSAGGTSTDAVFGSAVDAAGNILITGHFIGTVDFDPGAGTFNLVAVTSSDPFVWKLDASGNLVWARAFTGGNTVDQGKWIITDAAGNCYIAGQFGSGTSDFDPGAGTANLTSAGGQDLFIVKLDASGNYQWAWRDGGTGNERLDALNMDASGNFYLTGGFFNTTSLGGNSFTTPNGNADAFMVKLTPPATLPLQLVGFNVWLENEKAQLKWITDNEDGVSHFDIERSPDGSKFAAIGRVMANNNTSRNEYRHTDQGFSSNRVYYRVKIVDIDGDYSYSKVGSLRFAIEQKTARLYPTPAKATLTINTIDIAAETGQLTVHVYNSAGRLVKTAQVQPGVVRSLNIADLIKGSYFLRLSGGNKYQYTQTIIVQ